MKRLIHAIWKQGVLSTFLAGLLALLPLAITVAIVVWVVGYLGALLGPESLVGRGLRAIGLKFVHQADETTATAIGVAVAVVGIWLLGVFVKQKARHRFARWWNQLVARLPVVSSIYGTAATVVGMLKKDDQAELTAMSVVYCAFGRERGGGILGLLASTETYRFDGRDHRLVYIPTSPIPMSGGILFVPAESVSEVDMTAEQLMRIYFSMGILAPEVVPGAHRAGA